MSISHKNNFVDRTQLASLMFFINVPISVVMWGVVAKKISPPCLEQFNTCSIYSVCFKKDREGTFIDIRESHLEFIKNII